MKFCEQMCPFFVKCEIREPENGVQMTLTVEGVIQACNGREYLLKGYHINCKHLACKQGEGIANKTVREDATTSVLVPFASEEKGSGRLVDRKSGVVWSTRRDGTIGRTGQVIVLQ